MCNACAELRLSTWWRNRHMEVFQHFTELSQCQSACQTAQLLIAVSESLPKVAQRWSPRYWKELIFVNQIKREVWNMLGAPRMTLISCFVVLPSPPKGLVNHFSIPIILQILVFLSLYKSWDSLYLGSPSTTTGKWSRELALFATIPLTLFGLASPIPFYVSG